MDEIECIDSKWNLPDDMGSIYCKAISCPPFPDFGKTIETWCYKRDQACVISGKYENIDDRYIEDCNCFEAVSRCKPKFITSYNDTFHEIAPPRDRVDSHRGFTYHFIRGPGDSITQETFLRVE